MKPINIRNGGKAKKNINKMLTFSFNCPFCFSSSCILVVKSAIFSSISTLRVTFPPLTYTNTLIIKQDSRTQSTHQKRKKDKQEHTLVTCKHNHCLFWTANAIFTSVTIQKILLHHWLINQKTHAPMERGLFWVHHDSKRSSQKVSVTEVQFEFGFYLTI